MSFDRLSVLIVEDSAFARGMLQEILRTLKVGKVLTAADGAEAINILKQVGRNMKSMSGNMAAANVLAIDMVLCDYVMSPINGAMVLRWVRNHEDSPDRFMPFVMVSGLADSIKVHEARDLGTSEFLAKPFSVKSVAEHLITAIEVPRPFIYCAGYFGPDRRRQRRPYNDRERRVSTSDEIETVYSTTRMKGLNPKVKVFRFQLPNRLKEKIAGLGGGPITIPPDILAEAEQRIERMEGDYADWVRAEVQQLTLHHRRCVDDDDITRRPVHLAKINQLAHDLRGQGSTFGYPLITVFGRSLYECTASVTEVSDELIDFVKAHIDGISAVIREKIRGSGGEIGDALVTSLEQAREKLAQTF
ncbi:MAG: response regulator [Alphaproteobacteria bacterium]|nr:response regulator [Alphaproteobacteria bacterium]TAD90548.1 MAG: response regulator [Alphaproteobacteria bacterium]